MSKRAIIVLGLIAMALVAYIAVFERTSLTSKELLERKDRVLTTFVRRKVDRLEIQRKNRFVVLARELDDGDEFSPWKMLEPMAVEADEDAVDRVLGELEWLSARRTLEAISDDDIRNFGLLTPRYRVFYRAGGKRHVLTVGKEDVHGEGVYVRVDAEPVAFVVPKTLVEALDHEPLHYRSKEFLGSMTVAWARKLEVQTGGDTIEVVKDNGRFWVQGEPKTLADDRKVDEVLRTMDELRATRFLEGDAAKAAEADLAKPQRTLRLSIVPDQEREDKTPALIELELGGACADHGNERHARAGKNGSPVCIENADAKQFEVSANDLRLKRPFLANPSAIERFELASGGKKVALQRDGEKWKGEGDAQIDREAVEQWLRDLENEQAMQFVVEGPIKEAASLTLFLASEKTERIVLGGPSAGGVLVKRGDEPALVVFPPTVAQKLAIQKGRFLSLEPWQAHKPSEVTGIQVRDGDTKRSLALRDGTWRADKGPEVPDGQIRDLVRSLVKLRALAFVADEPRSEHGLQSPRGEVKLELTGGKTLTLTLGNDSERGVYARVDGASVVEVDREVNGYLRVLAGAGVAAESRPASDAHLHDDEDDEHDHEH